MSQFDPSNAIVEMRSIFGEEQRIYQTYKDIPSINEIQSGNSLIITPNNSKANFIRKKSHPITITNFGGSINVGLTEIWQTKGLIIITLIIRFIYQLKLQTDSMKYKLMNRRIYAIIADKAADYQNIDYHRQHINRVKQRLKIQIQYINLVRFIRIIFKYMLDNISVFHPTQKIIQLFQGILIILLTINLFYVPVNLSFLNQDLNNLFEILPLISEIIWILIQFNLAFYQDQKLKASRMEIAQNYIKNYFIQDSIIVLIETLRSLIGNYVYLSFFLKIFQLKRIYCQLEQNIYMRDNAQAFFQLTKLILTLILMTHCCACSWHYLGVFERESLKLERNWITYYQFEDLEWIERYVISLYFSVITTLTVGYGDITPQSIWEKLFVIIVAMNLCGILGYTVTNIGEIFRNINEKQQIYKTQMKAIEKIIRQRNLNEKLAIKVKKYFQHLFIQEQEDNNMGELLLTKLTRNLEEEVLIDTYQNIIQKSKLIKTLSQQTIQKLCTKVKINKYAPGDEIVKSLQIADSLMFLLSGEVIIQAQQNKSSVTLKTLSPNNVIGEQEFASDQHYGYSLISYSYSKVAIISRECFYEVLFYNQIEFEKMCKIRDELKFICNSSKALGKICEICSWTHSYLQCPFTFYQPNKLKILKSYTSSEIQNRKKFKFRKDFKTNALQVTADIQSQCLAYMFNNKILEGSLLKSETDEEASIDKKKKNSLELELSQESSEQLSFGDLESRKQPKIKLCENENKMQSVKKQLNNSYFFQSHNFQMHAQRFQALDLRNTVQNQVERLITPVINRTPFKKPSYHEMNSGQSQTKKQENNNTISLDIQKQLDLILAKLNSEQQNEKSLTYIGHSQNEETSLDFEIMQSYKFYFPKFNIDNVIKQINQQNSLKDSRHDSKKKNTLRLVGKKRIFKKLRRLIIETPSPLEQ